MLRNVLISSGILLGSTILVLIESVAGLPILTLVILMRIVRKASPVAQVGYMAYITMSISSLFPISVTVAALVTAGVLLAAQLKVVERRRQLAQVLIGLIGALLVGSVGHITWTPLALIQLGLASAFILRELFNTREASLQLILDTQWWKRL